MLFILMFTIPPWRTLSKHPKWIKVWCTEVSAKLGSHSFQTRQKLHRQTISVSHFFLNFTWNTFCRHHAFWFKAYEYLSRDFYGETITLLKKGFIFQYCSLLCLNIWGSCKIIVTDWNVFIHMSWTLWVFHSSEDNFAWC